MATVTGMTAAAMTAIRNGHITGADFDSANHLILTKFDGTQIDAGAIEPATSALAGVVELATNAETQAGTDAIRAVTPAGLASIPGNKVQSLAANSVAESASLSQYPVGVSVMALTTGSSWSLNSGLGALVTSTNGNTDRGQQLFYSSAGGTLHPQVWLRTWHSSNGGGGWTAWRSHSMISELTPASFTQTTAFTSYPLGWSRLYYTSSNSSSWDFSGNYGEVMTYVNGTDFAKQTWTLHTNGSGGPAEMWMRTANAAGGWSAWRKMITDPGAWTSWTPTWTTSTGSATPSFGNSTLDCRYQKIGRNVHCKFDLTFGSSTNFGTSPVTGDNWRFSLPFAAARSGDSIGFFELNQTIDRTVMARAKTVTTTDFGLAICSGRADAVAITNTGDADSLSPWTWASPNFVRGTLSYESAA